MPWYKRDDFMLLRLVRWNILEAQRLARRYRYDEIIEFKWLKAAEIKAMSDQP